jgi:hypothetical protein
MLRALAMVKATFPFERYDTDEEFAQLYAMALSVKQEEAKILANEIGKMFSNEG